MSLYPSHFLLERGWLNILLEVLRTEKTFHLFITDSFPCNLAMFADLESWIFRKGQIEISLV